MPACGSEGACLQGLEGLWAHKTGSASPVALQQQQQRFKHRQQPPATPAAPQPYSYLRRLLLSYLRVLHRILTYSLLAPAVWCSAWLCFLWLLLRLPLAGLKFLLKLLMRHRRRRRRGLGDGSRGQQQPGRSPRRRCVLVSGGSTVQAVQLARNLSRAGARVVVCELEGLLGLARFSTACARYYSLPRPDQPGAYRVPEYVAALKEIVRRERVDVYVPVSASNTAYYDGLAKAHLELLGCECFVPGAAEIAQLDDPLALLGRARLLGLPVPRHHLFASLEEAARLYENGGSLRGRHYALLAGPAGMRPRPADLRLPPTLAEFTRSRHHHQEPNRWLVIRDPGGTHYVTCTTVRDSKLLANVSCRLDEARGALVLEERPEVSRWLERFFSRGFGRAKVSGHLSFRLAASVDKPEELVAIGCRVGVGLPYLGYHSALHASLLLWRGCRHRPRPASLGLLQQQQQQQQQRNGLMRPTEPEEKLLDKREALFLYWDPLPYCVYCYLQLPFRRLLELAGPQQSQHKPPLAVVQ